MYLVFIDHVIKQIKRLKWIICFEGTLSIKYHTLASFFCPL
ncbi:hypothetical protein O9A_00467 [Bartonella koehlerae C-29]|uniref:Uncharacterized protein n=1 Tax=Bartonella koehlerae C-29 TaxID=1134510 RepID=A0A067W7D7_9HYPH|nr:hypothetical protein O9A_00467 [Bartonella koehlerae C-29]